MYFDIIDPTKYFFPSFRIVFFFNFLSMSNLKHIWLCFCLNKYWICLSLRIEKSWSIKLPMCKKLKKNRYLPTQHEKFGSIYIKHIMNAGPIWAWKQLHIYIYLQKSIKDHLQNRVYTECECRSRSVSIAMVSLTFPFQL